MTTLVSKRSGLWTGFYMSAVLAATGCATSGDPMLDEDDFSNESALAGGADFASTVKVVGTVDVGFARNINYTSTPRFRAVKFHVEAGAQLELFVRSTQGDPIAWFSDKNFKVIDRSDDANEETNSNISVESVATTGDYYLVFRDKFLENHHFTAAVVRLDLPANAPTVAIEPVYEALVTAGTLNTVKVATTGLPYLAQALADRWATEVPSTPGLQVGAYRLTVGTQTVWLVRKYLPGAGMEAGAYVQTGAMIGIAGGTTEKVDSWEH